MRLDLRWKNPNNLHDMRTLESSLEAEWRRIPEVEGTTPPCIVLGAPKMRNLDDWKHVAYEVELHAGRRGVLRTVYKAGIAHQTIPTAGDIFQALVNDARSVVGETFETWASGMGYDTDSRKAEETFRACLDTRLWLEAYIGLGVMRTIFEADPDDTSVYPSILLRR